MPIFYTPKPRQFHYKPRLYDPDLEDLERRKRLYAAAAEEQVSTAVKDDESQKEQGDADLEYFQRRVRELDAGERRKAAALSWRDLFRKREKPEFHYSSRLQQTADTEGEQSTTGHTLKRGRIGRRFDFNDPQYFRPVSAGKIMLYAGLAAMLLIYILF